MARGQEREEAWEEAAAEEGWVVTGPEQGLEGIVFVQAAAPKLLIRLACLALQ